MAHEIETTDDVRQRLEELKESGKLEGLDREADKVSGLLISEDNLSLAIQALEDLEARILQRENAHLEELRPYLHKMEIWRKQGFDTSGLADVLRQEHKDMKAVEKIFWRFEKIVERLVNMEKELFKLDAPDFEAEIEELRDMMTDPSRLGEISRRYHHMVERIKTHEKDRRRREDLRQTVERYRDMGYRVDRIEAMLDGDLKEVEVAVGELEDAVIILTDLRERLDGLDPEGREKRFERVRGILFNPDRVAEAIEEVEALEGPR